MKHKGQKRIQPLGEPINYTKFIIAIVSVIFAIVAIYLYTGFFITGELRDNDEQTEIESSIINYSEILAGSIFTRRADTYHVLIMDSNDRNFNMIYGLASMSELPLYNVDTAKTVNQFIVGVENNIANDPNTLKVTTPSILLINEGRITNHASGLEDIRKFLSD